MSGVQSLLWPVPASASKTGEVPFMRRSGTCRARQAMGVQSLRRAAPATAEIEVQLDGSPVRYPLHEKRQGQSYRGEASLPLACSEGRRCSYDHEEAGAGRQGEGWGFDTGCPGIERHAGAVPSPRGRRVSTDGLSVAAETARAETTPHRRCSTVGHIPPLGVSGGTRHCFGACPDSSRRH